MKDQVLRQVFENDSKKFGKQSKPRDQDPSMFQLLSWKPPQDEPWDFKKHVAQPDKQSEASKFTGRINHDKNEWLTENQDNYRKIKKLQDSDLYVQNLNEQTLKRIGQACDCKPDNLKQPQPVMISQQSHDYRNPADWNPKLQSDYRDKFQVKDIRDHNALMHQLEANSHNFKGNYRAGDHDGAYYYDQDKVEEVKSSSDEEFEEDELGESESARKMNTKFNRSAKVLDPNNPQDQEKLQRRLQRIKKFNGETRWLPDSAFTTYFGKPAWGAYGQGNVKPTIGGIMYGQHMLSHNVQPHRQGQDPQFVQSYGNALRFGANIGEIIPEPPRNCREEDRLNPKAVEELKSRNPLTGTTFEDAKKQVRDSKGRCAIATMNIKKPDLVNTLRFASETQSQQGDAELMPAPKQDQHKLQTNSQNKLQSKTETPQVKDSKQKEQKQKEVQKRPSSAQGRLQKNSIDKGNVDKSKSNIKAVDELKNDRKEQKDKKIEKARKEKLEKKEKADKNLKNSKKVVFNSDQKPNLDDSLAIPDKASNKFIDELRQKKEKANRLTAKVNEINPSLLIQNPKTLGNSAISRDLQEVKSFDDMNPPAHYLQSLDPVELNPKNYKGVPSDWLHRIPYAGKHQVKDIPAKDCLDFGH